MRAMILVPLVMAGCGLTLQERKEIVMESGTFAAEAAYQRALKAGWTADQASELAELARKEAIAVVEKAIPQAEDAKRSRWSGALAAVVTFLLQLAGAAFRSDRREMA